MEKNDSPRSFIQLVKFAIVGVSNCAIHECIYVVLMYFGMHYIPAYLIGFSVSVVNSYFWNNRFVFKESGEKQKRVWWRVLCKTYMAYSLGLVLGLLLLTLWMDVIKIENWFEPVSDFLVNKGFEGATPSVIAGAVASIADTVITLPINFVINKLWAFRQKNKESENLV